ncbi:aspartic peptidase domain-containing protein [Cunninghamella echinulata]|nr:aspartic peptidase domain-containing protein [Cunninghamella echinulata]
MYFSKKKIIILFNIITLLETAFGTNVIHLPLQRVSLKENEHLMKHKKRDDSSLLSSIFKNADNMNNNNMNDQTVALLNDVEIHQYGIQVQVGTPSTSFLLLLDTGSSDTWVPSIKCQRANGCVSNQKYDSSSSSTFISRPEKVNITYAIGYATGDYFQDQFSIGKNKQFAIKDQVLVRIDDNKGPIATQAHPSKDSTIIDGIFGVGYPAGTLMAMDKKNKETYLPFIMNLWKQSLIKEPIFSLSMKPDSSNDKTSEWLGELVLGGIDDSKHTDPIEYTKVIPNEKSGKYSHWLVNVLGFRFEGKPNNFNNFRFVEKTPFIVDTGSNFMYLPSGLANTLASHITGKEISPNTTFYNVDCSLLKNDDTPAIHVMFPTEKNATVSFPMSIPVSKLIGQTAEDECFLLFMPNPPNTAFTLGNFWIRHFVSVFDFGKNRIGFSKYSTSNIL